MTTIKDVARAAGVSIATVSRVFNNVGPVDEETRRHVRQVASQMKYVPNALGRSLSIRRTDAIGLLLPDLFGEFFSEVLRGSDQTAQQSHYHLVVSSSHNNKEEIEAALAMMRGRVDGLIIMSPHLDAESLNENLPQSQPVVLLNCYVQSDGFDALNVDNFGGAYAMTKHLLSHGHERIAIIKGTERNFDAAERLRGYRLAMQEAGRTISPDFEIGGNFSESGGYDAAQKLIAIAPRPTAIFACNDSMAIGAMSALRDAGVQIPEEVALAGFDDVPIAPYLTPALTSVHVGIHNLGVKAIETVLHAVRNKNGHHKQQITLETTLSLRESCGCEQQHITNTYPDRGGDVQTATY
ncbi:MAG: LacI family DNA-binding transcriptional regulator [Ignavibacteriae bacterium]|nr:LacI family DNA-binding transcriptional regulator [Ignavibacteriota bacterium]